MIAFIGRSRSVCGTSAIEPAFMDMPVLMPESRDLRSDHSDQRPPISIAPTPM